MNIKTPIMKFQYNLSKKKKEPKIKTHNILFKYVVYLIDLRNYPKILEEFDNAEDDELDNLIIKYQGKFLIPQNILATFRNKEDAQQFCYNYEIPNEIRIDYYVTYAKLPISRKNPYKIRNKKCKKPKHYSKK